MDIKKSKPESLMMTHGYKPASAQNSLKSPVYQTSTFVFNSAEEGKRFFELALGLKEAEEGEEAGMIYSRLNNPNLQIVEKRLCLWDEAEDCAIFESGMAAISTTLLEFLNPGDLLLYSTPIYGGAHYFIENILIRFGVEVLSFRAGQSEEEIISIIEKSGKADRLAMIYAETPANPTSNLINISDCHKIAQKYSSDEKQVLLTVDNTYLGPLWQHPLKHGADLVVYSATKYIGGHSDLVAGACLGRGELLNRIKGLRTYLGNMAGPNTAWLLMRSLETLKVRMDAQALNAQKVAEYLRTHPTVKKINYLGNIPEGDNYQTTAFNQQCTSAGAMISFEIEGGEKEAFSFLNNLKLIKLAVSLGSTESLAEHPASMTHAGIEKEVRDELGIRDNLVRLSIGIENSEDILADLQQAFEN